MELETIIRIEVNSGMLNFENHNANNGFMLPDLSAMSDMLEEYGYEPVGICKNVPFNPHSTDQVAFVYRHNGEIYWCHMPKLCWINLISD